MASMTEASTGAGGVQLQDAQEFDSENASLVEQQIAEEARRNIVNPPKKKAKKFIDLDALAAEKIALEEIGDTNWIGRLNEYRAAHPIAGAGGLTLVDGLPGDATNPRFTCTASISETANYFGGVAVSFSTKKAARQYASKKAIDWLIENNFMPADGSVKFKAVQLPSVSQTPSGSGTGSTANVPSTIVSFATQVPGLCYRLGFNPPKYEVIPVVPGAAFYNAWADFGGDPRIEGKVGEVSNVYGKKNAKEDVARTVVSFLQDIERQRLAEYDD